MPGEGGANEEDRQRQIEDDVDEDAPRGTDPEQQSGTDDGTEEDAEAAERRIEPDSARQLLPIDEVMEHHLLGRTPQTSGKAMDDEQHAGLPQLQRVREEEDPPTQGHDHEHDLSDLDEAAAVEAFGQRPGIDGQEQEGQPVADELESDERRDSNFCISTQ